MSLRLTSPISSAQGTSLALSLMHMSSGEVARFLLENKSQRYAVVNPREAIGLLPTNAAVGTFVSTSLSLQCADHWPALCNLVCSPHHCFEMWP